MSTPRKRGFSHAVTHSLRGSYRSAEFFGRTGSVGILARSTVPDASSPIWNRSVSIGAIETPVSCNSVPVFPSCRLNALSSSQIPSAFWKVASKTQRLMWSAGTLRTCWIALGARCLPSVRNSGEYSIRMSWSRYNPYLGVLARGGQSIMQARRSWVQSGLVDFHNAFPDLG